MNHEGANGTKFFVLRFAGRALHGLVDQSRLAPLDASIIGTLTICSGSFAALRSFWRVNTVTVMEREEHEGWCWRVEGHEDILDGPGKCLAFGAKLRAKKEGILGGDVLRDEVSGSLSGFAVNGEGFLSLGALLWLCQTLRA